MCSLVKLSNGVSVASIKKDHIDNIIEHARECSDIDKIILFGSSAGTKCDDGSDIDIAVFSQKPRMKFMSSKSFRLFIDKVYGFDENQSYDVIYFKTGQQYKDAIFDEVMKGSVIYGS
jgi:predicted nucleotidyltransferase